MKKSPMNKKEYLLFTVVLVVSIIVFFGMLALAAFLQERGVRAEIYTPIGVGSFIIGAASLVFIFVNYSRAMGYEASVKIQKIDDAPRETIDHFDIEKIRDLLKDQGFKPKDDYLHKRKFSFAKDYINYYVCFSESTNADSEIDRLLKRFDSRNYSSQNNCLILLISLNQIEEKDIQALKALTKAFKVTEEIQSYMRFNSTVCFLVDRSTGIAYYVNSPKTSISVYSHGVRLVEKLCKKARY